MMDANEAVSRYRRWYRRLLRLYAKPYSDRFGEAMEQTFGDLLQERVQQWRGLLSCALWVFLETLVGIVRENFRSVIMQTTPGVAGGAIAYRAAVGVGAATALLQVWMHFVLGTEEDNSGGMIFAPAIVFGIGAMLARLKPQGMVRVLIVTALAQAVAAVIEMVAWQQYVEFAILNGVFIALWLGAGTLFRRAGGHRIQAEANLG